MKKVRVYVHPELAARTITNMPVHFLKVRLDDGREFNFKRDNAEGFPGRPLSSEQLLRKYRYCLGNQLPPSMADYSAEIMRAFEKEGSVQRLIRALTPSEKD